MERKRLRIIVSLIIAVVGVGGIAMALEGTGGYAAVSRFDATDASGVTAHPVIGLDTIAGDGLAVDSTGRVYLIAIQKASNSDYHQDLLTFRPGSNGPTDIESLLSMRMTETAIRAVLVAPATVTDDQGTEIMAKDDLVLVVDGSDSNGVTFRELWRVDPDAAGDPGVLFRRSPEPTRHPTGVSGQLSAAMGEDGSVYFMEESSGVAPDGSIRRISWSDSQGAWQEASPVTGTGTVTGSITMGPDGYLYAIARAGSEEITDAILKIDPWGTDSYTEYASVGKKLEVAVANGDLVFDSEGTLFLRMVIWKKGAPLWIVTAVPSGEEVGTDLRIGSTSIYLLEGHFASGPSGTLYFVERDSSSLDGDVVFELAPDPNGGGGGNGNGNGGGKGNGKDK